ncbi:hypothetical protein ON010_g16665 [Phytophthora cinnamomi]|nr:hypothetical protein ON010_g16665 [Phytophthora cinnamomi]
MSTTSPHPPRARFGPRTVAHLWPKTFDVRRFSKSDPSTGDVSEPSKSWTTIKYRVQLFCTDDGFTQIKGEHTCNNEDSITARDVQDEMHQLLELRSLGDLRVVPGWVWRTGRDDMIKPYGTGAGLRIIGKTEGIDITKRCRNDASGGDVFRAIETKEVRITPEPFTQTVIVMVYDNARDLYIPVSTLWSTLKITGRTGTHSRKPVEAEMAKRNCLEYFVATSCEMYELPCWNIADMIDANVEIDNRTNNPLEAYNRKLADTFGAAHHTLLEFV